MNKKKYKPYSTEEFNDKLYEIGIYRGDSVFIMHSMDNIYHRTGNRISPKILLEDILEYLGPEGNLMTLCFSSDRKSIISGKKIFDIKRTPTMSGLMAELLRRRSNAVRSMHPIWSAVAIGPKAEYFCGEHHLTEYPFDEYSPYWKITKDGGKYLGIGLGFEAFTPLHIVDDHFKENFKYKMYYDRPDKFICVDRKKSAQEFNFFLRDPKTQPLLFNPSIYLGKLNVAYSTTEMASGIVLFSLRMDDCIRSAILLYDREKITVWDGRSLAMLFREIFIWIKRKIKTYFGAHFRRE